ncbi:MAG: dTMP kinase [bacterium]
MKDTFPGKLITFEGGEGAGKSTQTGLLKEYLEEKGRPVILTREPGGTRLGESLREILLKSGGDIVPLAELLLHQAARAQHLEEIIKPALRAGTFVLCDRFFDSTAAYQVFGGGVEEKTAGIINSVVGGDFAPDLTVLLDIEPEAGLSRCHQPSSPDRYERKSPDFHNRVRRGFLTIADREPERFFVLSARKDIEELKSEIRKRVSAAFL